MMNFKIVYENSMTPIIISIIGSLHGRDIVSFGTNLQLVPPGSMHCLQGMPKKNTIIYPMSGKITDREELNPNCASAGNTKPQTKRIQYCSAPLGILMIYFGIFGMGEVSLINPHFSSLGSKMKTSS